MNFTITIAAIMWIRFENAHIGATRTALRYLGAGFVLFSAVAFAAIYLLPDGLVAAKSFALLKAEPAMFIVSPVLFGISTGLNVFTYGSRISFLKSPLVALAFVAISEYGFVIGTVVNIAFFILNSRERRTAFQSRGCAVDTSES